MYQAKLDTGKKIDLTATTLRTAKQEAIRFVTDCTGVKLVDGGIHVAYHAPSANRAPGERYRWVSL